MEQVAKATRCIFVQKALKWPKSLVAHVAIATCASAKRPLQARVRWHDASQVAWSLLPEPISLRAGARPRPGPDVRNIVYGNPVGDPHISRLCDKEGERAM